MDVIGTDALVRPEGEAYTTSPWQHLFLSSRADTITGGTSELQRTIIAERVLGLPR
jgi:alkylation response protein AidB-like acyl-CoA dehydrogenase